MSFKNPYVLPAFVCGACGHELLNYGEVEAGVRRFKCYTSRCSQHGQTITIGLVEVQPLSCEPLATE
jgi:hypothetical protein